MEGVIARRYAKAFLGLCPDDAAIQETAAGLTSLANDYDTAQDFRSFMSEPRLKLAAKVETVGQLAASAGANELTQKFARFLTHKNRFELIGFVARAFDKMAMEKLGQGRAKIVTAFKMTATEEKALAKKLSDYTELEVALEVEVDETILGGAVTQIGSLVLDGSVKNRLNLIKETISRGN